jgi:hypothetical protein
MRVGHRSGVSVCGLAWLARRRIAARQSRVRPGAGGVFHTWRMAAKKRGPKVVTEAHKAAMATGRAESRAVSDYLEVMAANKPKRGRKRTAETISNRLAAVADELVDADMVTRVHLIQERMDLETELAVIEDVVDLSYYENEFVKVAKNYSARRGISYAAWREAGIDAALLKRAGIHR